MIIRKAILTDLDEIVAIYNAAIETYRITADTEPIKSEDRIEWFHTFDEKRPLWVSEENNQVTGWMSFKSFYGRPAYECTVEIAIYIHPSYQSKGIGSLLLEESLRVAPSLNIKNLLAFVFAQNEPSLIFFRKKGFSDYGNLPAVAEINEKLCDLIILGKRI